MPLFRKIAAFQFRTLLLAACALSVAGCASAGKQKTEKQKADTWFHGVPARIRDARSGVPIPDRHYYEISASKLAAVEHWLADKPVAKLEREEAGTLGQTSFTCPKRMTPYLVRAIYNNSGGGTFSIVRVGRALWISQYSLGGGGPMHHTGLVVCLKFRPTAIYHSLGGAL